MNNTETNTFQIAGLQRSGTNYIKELIENNFYNTCFKTSFYEKNKTLPPDYKKKFWKHSLIKWDRKFIDKSDPIFIIYKNPYRWIESIVDRTPRDWNIAQPSEYRCNIICNNKNLIAGKNNFYYPNLVKAYNFWFKNWIFNSSLESYCKVVIIKYEDLLEEKKRDLILSNIEKTLNFKKKNENWINPDKVRLSKKFDFNDKQYYLNDNCKVLSRANINIINSLLDNRIFQYTNYKIL